MAVRRVTFRLYPNKAQTAKLHEWRRMHKDLYNAALANRKTQYQKFGHSVNYFEQQNCLPAFKEVWAEYKELGSQALQATLKRVDLAFKRFFSGLGGYPKFKSIRHYSGWTYPAKSGWTAETDGGCGHLVLSNLGRMQMRGQARTWGTPTTCTIIFRNGQWYASITVNCEPVRTTGEGAVGIDLGCKEAITLSTSEQISKPEFIKEGQRKVKAASKKLRRKRAPNRNKKIKASRRWKKHRQAVSKLQRKVTRQREDWLHQTTSNIVSGNSLVAGEQLNVKGMTASAKKGKRKAQKAGLNRSILEVGFAMIGKMFEYKLAEAGGFYVESPTRKLKPSQRCAKCWELTPKTLKDRTHICSNPRCGHVEDRDINAAQVNLIWAKGLGTSLLDAEPSSSTKCGSMKQLGAKKRQKSQQVGDAGLETPSAYAVG
ncbi:MAG: RNA-guided endonuclease InsQ/TnpB family protein [Microcoleus sp.]